MKKFVGFCEFQDSFRDAGRENSFSYEGLKALYDYITQIEEDCGIEMELDVIALDWEFTEYSSIKEAYEVYQDAMEEGDSIEEAKEWLQEQTQVIELDGGIIISNF